MCDVFLLVRWIFISEKSIYGIFSSKGWDQTWKTVNFDPQSTNATLYL